MGAPIAGQTQMNPMMAGFAGAPGQITQEVYQKQFYQMQMQYMKWFEEAQKAQGPKNNQSVPFYPFIPGMSPFPQQSFPPNPINPSLGPNFLNTSPTPPPMPVPGQQSFGTPNLIGNNQHFTQVGMNQSFEFRSSQEREYFESLFKRADQKHQGVLELKEAAEFLKKSKLAKNTLQSLFRVIVPKTAKSVDQITFFGLMRLVAAVQEGLPCSLDSKPKKLPEFEGIPLPVMDPKKDEDDDDFDNCKPLHFDQKTTG